MCNPLWISSISLLLTYNFFQSMAPQVLLLPQGPVAQFIPSAMALAAASEVAGRGRGHPATRGRGTGRGRGPGAASRGSSPGGRGTSAAGRGLAKKILLMHME
jgi:hypothetical protein